MVSLMKTPWQLHACCGSLCVSVRLQHGRVGDARIMSLELSMPLGRVGDARIMVSATGTACQLHASRVVRVSVSFASWMHRVCCVCRFRLHHGLCMFIRCFNFGRSAAPHIRRLNFGRPGPPPPRLKVGGLGGVSLTGKLLFFYAACASLLNYCLAEFFRVPDGRVVRFAA